MNPPTSPASGAPSPEAGRPVVLLRDAVKRFGATTALNGLSLTVRAGESHGLIGRNGAGKSTLVSVLTGLQELDSGALQLHGAPAPPLTDRKAWLSQVSCVYQHRTLVPELTIAENLSMHDYGGHRWIRWRSLNRRAAEELERWDIGLAPNRPVAGLGVGEAQMVEIVRALAHGARFVILDEPTAQLVAGEIDKLIEHVGQLRRRGVTFLFISHHLDEVPRICDTVTVLRNGRDVLRGRADELSTDDLVSAMVGEDDGDAFAVDAGKRPSRSTPKAAEPVLRATGMRVPGLADDFSLTLGPGDAVGLAGHSDSGVRELALTLAGHNRRWTGRLDVGGRPVPRRWDSRAAIRAGVTLVPEDRIKSGLIAAMSIEDNITLPMLHKLRRPVLLDLVDRRRTAEGMRQNLGVASSSVRQPVGQLSGGNQQKVLLGAALGPAPAVLVLLHPTAGVDIASKTMILQLIERHRAEGLAVVMVSDEPAELGFCDRVQVWVRGRRAAEGTAFSEEELVGAMEGATTLAGDPT